MPYNMRWLKIDNSKQAEKALTQVGVDSGGLPYMRGKAMTHVIKLEKVPSPAAHILKQEMLSLGGDAAVHRDLIVNRISHTDLLLLGNVKQLKKLASKLRAQPFGLKRVAESLLQLLLKIDGSLPVRNLDCRGIALELGNKTLIMGILNATPDSFSDGGMFLNPQEALAQAERMVVEGVDLIDIGGESTRPGHLGISAEEEWMRLQPIVSELIEKCPVPISVDTQKALVAEKALEAGVHMINDIWGLQKDPLMSETVAKYNVPIVLMHNKVNTEYDDLIGEVLEFLSRSIDIALDSGIKKEQIIVDPGIGFGKTADQNIEVLARLGELRTLGYPILLGVSRKSVIGRTLNLPVEQRLEPSIALGTLGIAAGVDILRVHNVLENKKAALMTDQIVRRNRGEMYEGK